MGRAIAERFPEARAVYDEASEAVGYDVAQVCFEGPIEKLTRTDVQQPALVATSLACLRAVDTLGIKRGLRRRPLGRRVLRARRGRIAPRSGRDRARPGARAGDGRGGRQASRRDGRGHRPRGRGRRGALRRDRDVWPANYNCPGQVVVSGENAAVDQLIEEASAARRAQDREASRQRRLPQPARRGRGRHSSPGARGQSSFSDPVTPFMSTVTARVEEAQRIGGLLVEQLTGPVKWTQAVRELVAAGRDHVRRDRARARF